MSRAGCSGWTSFRPPTCICWSSGRSEAAACRPSSCTTWSGTSPCAPAEGHGDHLGRGGLGLDLIHPALPGRLVRTPAHEAGPVPEAAAGDVVVADLRH